MTSNTFDIGPSEDLAIFTNDSDDVFNTNGGPSFSLDQGNDYNMSDTGMIDNLVSDIKIDFPDDSPIDFIHSPQAPKVYPKVSSSTYSNPSPKLINRSQRQRAESFSSNSTIEAEPVRKHTSTQSRQYVQPPKISSHVQTHRVVDEPIIENFNFDELLDAKKLKKSDDSSVDGDSQSTIRGSDFKKDSSNFRKTHDERLPYNPDNIPQPSYSQPSYSQPSYSQPSYSQPSNEPPSNEQENKYISEDEEKLDLLLKLNALEKRQKITLSKHFSLKSPIDEIRMEYKHQSSLIEQEESLAFMKKGLIFCTSGMEYMNRRFDPLGAKLDGWGEDVMQNIMDYDGIFERLHQKYSGSVKMEPEMELLFALGGSAFMFHLSHTLFKTAMPQFGNVMRENPDLMKGVLGAVQEASNRSKQSPVASNDGQSNQMQSPNIDFSSILSQMGIGGEQMGGFAKSFANGPPPPVATKDFKEPSVTDIYRKMAESGQINNNSDDMLSMSSVDSERSIGSGSKKAIISPNPNRRGGNVIRLS
jgi:hypothetical protein